MQFFIMRITEIVSVLPKFKCCLLWKRCHTLFLVCLGHIQVLRDLGKKWNQLWNIFLLYSRKLFYPRNICQHPWDGAFNILELCRPLWMALNRLWAPDQKRHGHLPAGNGRRSTIIEGVSWENQKSVLQFCYWDSPNLGCNWPCGSVESLWACDKWNQVWIPLWVLIFCVTSGIFLILFAQLAQV